MSQIIIRVLDSSEDIEIYQEEDTKAVFEKIISRTDLIEALQDAVLPYKKNRIRIDLMDEYDKNTIYIEQAESSKVIYYNFEERMIKCQYNGKGYNIIHPNTIFIIYVDNNRVNSIKAICYKTFAGKKTVLFKYPLPNQLGQDSMCLGTVENSYTTPLNAILNAIEANYTHHWTGFVDSKFKDTKALFEYLSSNPFPYDLLKSESCVLEDILNKVAGVDYLD